MNMHKSQIRTMMAYFTLAMAVIGFYWIVIHLDVILSWIGWLFNVMGPFIAGFIMAYLLSIPVNGMQRLLGQTKINFIVSWKKGISVIVVYLLFVFIIYMSLHLLVPRIIFAVVDLVSSFPFYYQQLSTFVEDINQSGQFPFPLNLQEIFEEFFGVSDASNPWNFITYEAVLSYLGTILGGANIVFRAFLAIVSSIYFLFEAESLAKYIKRVMNVFLSGKVNTVVLGYGQKINQYFKKYIFCLIMDCVIMGIVGTILLTLLGSPYAVFLGLLLGVLNLIPYFGSIFATLVAVIVVWLTQGFAMGAISAVILLISQQLDANVLQPRLYGTSLKLSPLLVIISVSVGGAIGGLLGSAVGGTIMGMIVAIPCAKVLMNILEDVIDHRESHKKADMKKQIKVSTPEN